MRFILKRNVHLVLVFVIKVLGYLIALNLIILPILWILNALYLFTLVLVYESFLTTFLGVLQILGSYIYREDSIPFRWGFRTGWFDFRKFANLKPEERQRYRQEGIILVIIGLALLFGIIVAHVFILAYS